MTRFWHDLRYAGRRLRRHPAFAATALVCIALGVGVTTTIFSAVNGILLRPLPFPRDEQLLVVRAQHLQRDIHAGRISWADYASWRDGNTTLSALGIWSTGFLQLNGPEGDVERVDSAQVSPSVLPVLGVHPLLGRIFSESDAQPGHDHVVLLSFALWQRRFGGDRTLVDRSIQVAGQPYTVVGILPEGVSFPEGTQIWLPVAADAARERHGTRQFTGAIGRLRPQATLTQARADLGAISAQLQQAFPQDNAGWDAEVASLRDDLVGALRRPILVFLGAAAVVLLIATGNVGSLMLARSALHRRDTAIAVAMGASRSQIVRQVLIESVLLALAGGVLGTLLAQLGLRVITLAFPDGVPSYLHISIDGTVVGFSLLVSLATGVLLGLVPALRTTHVTLVAALREAGRGADRGSGRWLRSGLVSAEVALSLILLIAATLLVRSDWTLEREIGFQPAGVLSFRVPLPVQRYAGPARRAFYEQLAARIRAIPGVQAVGSAQGLPFGALGGSYERVQIVIDGQPAAEPGDPPSLRQQISTDYFRAMGVPVLMGRAFSETDYDSGIRHGIVNDAFVRRYFATGDPLGRRLRVTNDPAPDPWITVVGVVRNARQDRPPQPIEPSLFVPFTDATQTFAVRTTLSDPLIVAPRIRALVKEMDQTLPMYLVQSLEHVVNGALWRPRLQGRALSIFAVLALVLSVVGVYGVISYTVAQETRELGVRLALGATRGRVIGLVLARGARLALAGVAVGVGGALLLMRVIANLLYGVQPTDPATFIGAAAVLGTAAVLAGVSPALRAARVDPLEAMRAE